jgi:transcriptional regulator with XRE-family HTH domain
MTFAKQLQAARAAAGLSQSQAALAIGRSVRTLQAWEQSVNVPHAQIQALALAALKSVNSTKKQAENDSSAGTGDTGKPLPRDRTA